MDDARLSEQEVAGSEADLASITQEVTRSFHGKNYFTNGAFVIAGGTYDRDALERDLCAIPTFHEMSREIISPRSTRWKQRTFHWSAFEDDILIHIGSAASVASTKSLRSRLS